MQRSLEDCIAPLVEGCQKLVDIVAPARSPHIAMCRINRNKNKDKSREAHRKESSDSKGEKIRAGEREHKQSSSTCQALELVPYLLPSLTWLGYAGQL